MSYITLVIAVAIFVCGLLFFRVKKLPFFEPIFRADFPDELKPFFRMKSCKYRATANPRHKVLPELEKILKENDIRKANVDIIAHKFEYGGYASNDKWYETLVEILKKGGGVNIIGGNPSENRLKVLWELKKLGANIRFLTEPPITHLFIYLHDSYPTFIWFEKEHIDERATCIAYTTSPSEDDAKLAKNYFGDIWEEGVPIKAPHA